jgi:ribosomal protein L29
MKHTWNTFKSKIKDMTKEQKEDFLKELHNTYIIEYTKAHRGGNVKTVNLRLIRKQIAYLKTILNYKGFSYNPR